MRVGIVADTHGSLRSETREALTGCDHIIHAGDICASSVIGQLETIAPLTAVLGNCDASDFGPDVCEEADVTLDGVRFHVVHKPSSLGVPNPARYDVAVCGHTHRAAIEHVNGVLLINPGSPTRPRGGKGPSIAIVEVAAGVVESVRIVPIG
jgi:putative phosphoesterase